MSAELFELGLIVCIAAVLGILARLLRQPALIAYLATGAVIGAMHFLKILDNESLPIFAELGVMFLLFLVGLEINFASLRLVGKTALVLGFGQIFFTTAFGLLLGLALGYGWQAALFIAITLTFSSTIIIVKLLSDKKDTSSLYGKISIGMMLVQDVVAIFLLIVLSGIRQGDALDVFSILRIIGLGVGMFITMFFLGRRYLPMILDRIARSGELLFISSLAWVFLVAAIASRLGLTIEIAGLLAGLGLSNSAEHHQISGRIRPLRDFFILIFFVLLGSSIMSADFTQIGWPILAFSGFVLIGNPLIVVILMGLMGYRRRTGFLTGVTVAQISEFSLILAGSGKEMGILNSAEIALITGVGITTILASTYLILNAEKIFPYFRGLLGVFERKSSSEPDLPKTEIRRPIVLIGFHRTGRSIARRLDKRKLLIIDFDPDTISRLKSEGYACLFGDIKDPETLENAALNEAQLVISTSPDLDDNLAMIEHIKNTTRKNKRAFVIVRSENESDAEQLYRQGADYVLIPHISSGHSLGAVIALDQSLKTLKKMREKENHVNKGRR